MRKLYMRGIANKLYSKYFYIPWLGDISISCWWEGPFIKPSCQHRDRWILTPPRFNSKMKLTSPKLIWQNRMKWHSQALLLAQVSEFITMSQSFFVFSYPKKIIWIFSPQEIRYLKLILRENVIFQNIRPFPQLIS